MPISRDEVILEGDPYAIPPTGGGGGGGTDLDSLNLSTNESSDDDLFVTKEDGGTAWVKKSFLKIWNYISLKLGIFIGTSATWEAKTQEEKDLYTLEFITDDNINSQTSYDIPHNQTNVGDTLDELDSALNDYSTGTITKVPSTGTFEQTCYKLGKQVVVGARLTDSSFVATGHIFTIPTGFRPKAKVNCIVVVYYNNYYIPVWGEITTEGKVNFWLTSNTATIAFFSASYPIE